MKIKFRLYKSVFVFLIMLTTTGLFCQPKCDYNLMLHIIDLDNGNELDGTFVILKSLNQTQITNEHGNLKFINLCEGDYEFVVQHLGCKDTTIKITLLKNTKITIKIPHSAIELKEIDVMDKQQDVLKTQSISELKEKELDATRGQSLGEALKMVTGVTTLNSGSTISKPMIHGMQGYRILILNNGIRQEGQQWGNEHAPEIDPFIAQKISVIKGANAIRYGSDAMAGVILVEPNELPDTAAITGEINLVGMNNGKTGVASGILQGNFEKIKHFSWRVQGTYKKGGTIKTPTYFLRNTSVEELNYSYALRYHRKKWGVEMYYSQFNSKVGIFNGAHIGNLTDLKAAFNLSKPQDSLATFNYDIKRPYQDIEHELVKGKLHLHLAPRWLVNVQYAYQYNIRKEFDKTPSRSTKFVDVTKAELDYRITSQTIDFTLEHLNIKSFRGQLGGSYMHQKNVYIGRYFVPNFLNNTWGVFATERYVKQHIELEVGIRYDQKNLKSFYYIGNDLQKPILNFNNLSWNVGAIIKPTKQLHFFLNLGSAWRAPSPNELYSNGIHQALGSIERGDANLKTEQVYNIAATGIYQAKYTSIEISAYHNQFNNFIYLNPGTQPELTIKGAYPVFNYKQANARISGIDAKATTSVAKHIQLITKAMILRAWNYSINDYLVYMPSDRYSLDAKIFTELSKNITDVYAQIGYQFITKQWRVPSNTDFAPPPKAYGLLNAEVGTTIEFKHQTINISIAGNNILNTQFRDYLDRFRYFANSIGSNYTLRIKVPLTIYDKK